MIQRIVRIVISLTPLLAIGCAGSGTIQLVSLNMTDIDPPEAKAWRFDAQENYWWIDANGELNIAMKHQHTSLLMGKYGSYHVGLSLVFDEPPAGRARNYKVGPREARANYTSAMANMRFTPFAGIVAVVIGKDGVLRGSYRLWSAVASEINVLSILPQKSGNLLMFGVFEAVKDEVRGKKLRAIIETGAPPRPPKKLATSQPTTRP